MRPSQVMHGRGVAAKGAPPYKLSVLPVLTLVRPHHTPSVLPVHGGQLQSPSRQAAEVGGRPKTLEGGPDRYACEKGAIAHNFPKLRHGSVSVPPEEELPQAAACDGRLRSVGAGVNPGMLRRWQVQALPWAIECHLPHDDGLVAVVLGDVDEALGQAVIEGDTSADSVEEVGAHLLEEGHACPLLVIDSEPDGTARIVDPSAVLVREGSKWRLGRSLDLPDGRRVHPSPLAHFEKDANPDVHLRDHIRFPIRVAIETLQDGLELLRTQALQSVLARVVGVQKLLIEAPLLSPNALKLERLPPGGCPTRLDLPLGPPDGIQLLPLRGPSTKRKDKGLHHCQGLVHGRAIMSIWVACVGLVREAHVQPFVEGHIFEREHSCLWPPGVRIAHGSVE
mmetsp:Transcript_69385/g.148485  ORF Transcript_69385/g.148485 Transcript_69385/m.148485 type:complete len:394 (-) Transcript_69385:485-1666(-)